MRFGDENGTNLRRSPFSLVLVPLDLEDEVIYAACIEKGGRSGRVQELTLKDSEEPPSHGPKREPPQCHHFLVGIWGFFFKLFQTFLTSKMLRNCHSIAAKEYPNSFFKISRIGAVSNGIHRTSFSSPIRPSFV